MANYNPNQMRDLLGRWKANSHRHLLAQEAAKRGYEFRTQVHNLAHNEWGWRGDHIPHVVNDVAQGLRDVLGPDWNEGSGYKVMPMFYPDGTEIETKDITAMSGAGSLNVGIGTVVQSLGTVPRPKRVSRKPRKPKRVKNRTNVVAIEDKALRTDTHSTIMVALSVIGVVYKNEGRFVEFEPTDLLKQPHITLAFYGEVGDWEPERMTQGDIIAQLSRIAENLPPFSVNVTGFDRFTGNDDSDEAIVLRVESEAVMDLRKMTVGLFGPDKSSYPDYKPHYTLEYVPKGSPVDVRVPAALEIDAIVLAWGNDYMMFPLSTTIGEDILN